MKNNDYWKTLKSYIKELQILIKYAGIFSLAFILFYKLIYISFLDQFFPMVNNAVSLVYDLSLAIFTGVVVYFLTAHISNVNRKIAINKLIVEYGESLIINVKLKISSLLDIYSSLLSLPTDDDLNAMENKSDYLTPVIHDINQWNKNIPKLMMNIVDHDHPIYPLVAEIESIKSYDFYGFKNYISLVKRLEEEIQKLNQS